MSTMAVRVTTARVPAGRPAKRFAVRVKGHQTRVDPGESEAVNLDRNLHELLEELRVALPGVQVLFAFLLVAPFNQRFSSLSTGQERLYLVALVFAGLAVAFLLAPAAHHRMTF